MVPGLTPFSEYSLIIMTFNRRGNGPGSHAVNFKTPEGGKTGGERSVPWNILIHYCATEEENKLSGHKLIVLLC
jgi:hypothetical protein